MDAGDTIRRRTGEFCNCAMGDPAPKFYPNANVVARHWSHPHCDEFILPSMGDEVIGEVASFMYSSANRFDGERKIGRHVVHETGLCRHRYQNEHSLYQMTGLRRYD